MFNDSNVNKISIYVRNSNLGPSCYYRVIQYTNQMDKSIVIHDALTDELFQINLNLKPSISKKAFQAILFLLIYCRRMYQMIGDLIFRKEIIVIQREIFPRCLPMVAGKILKKLATQSKIIWDFDDDIFEGEISEREAIILEELSDKVIVTSDFLKNKLNSDCQKHVILLPTSDSLADESEIANLVREREQLYDSKIKIVWIGTAVNLKNIDQIFDCIEHVGKKLRTQGRELELNIVCNVAYWRIPENFIINNIKWSRLKAEEVARNAHIGIMPLVDEEFSKGKGGFKLIQYMSCGLAVVASSVGFNNQILHSKEDGFCCRDSKEWENALIELTMNKSSWRKYSENAYQNYKTNFDRKKNEMIWQEVLKYE